MMNDEATADRKRAKEFLNRRQQRKRRGEDRKERRFLFDRIYGINRMGSEG
jgi:hypothetical protein